MVTPGTFYGDKAMRSVGIFVWITLGGIAGCHGGKPDTGAAPAVGATLTLENQGFTDMTIYAATGTTGRVRLGQVVANTTQHLPIPGYLIQSGGPIRFIADPIGGFRKPVSDELLVSPGDSLTLTIPPQ
jgi:hypothetical protein